MMGRTLREQMGENLKRVQSRMSEACARVGREPGSVRLIAVVKYAPEEWARELVSLGMPDLAESRPQQLEERAASFPAEVKWHLIGHLQSNKVRKVLPLVKQIHSVDSGKLWLVIQRIGEETGAAPDLLFEVNVSGEESKQGFRPEEVLQLWRASEPARRGQVKGLMTMAPNTGSLDDARRTFAGLRELRERMREISGGGTLGELSMGMTGDFEVGIEEGATQVRIGSALFEGLE